MQLDFESLEAPPPEAYGIVGFPKWRPYQHETVTWALEDVPEGMVNITENPTGSGKSMLAMALLGNPVDYSKQVVVLTESRNLQRQYGDLFRDCHTHFGRSNYRCVHPENRLPYATAAECLYEGNMRKCAYFDACPYVLSRDQAIWSHRTALNYAYWLTSRKLFKPYWLVLDEAHNLSDIVLDHVGMSVGEHMRARFDLPAIPEIRGSDWSLFGSGEKPHDAAMAWLEESITIMAEEASFLKHEVDTARRSGNADSKENVALSDRYTQLTRETDRFRQTLLSLRSNSGEHWYIRAAKDAGYYRGQVEPALICRPLTARYDFNKFFAPIPRTLIMSATIGDMDTFATELGIVDYKTRVVPNQWPPSSRPVHILPVPSMGRKSAERDAGIWDKQASEIAKGILSCPPEWSGLVLVTRKAEANLLAQRLARFGLADRLFVTPGFDGNYTPTEQQVAAWDVFRKRTRGAICVTWALWQGYDGTEEKICVVAKTPFPYLGSPYEVARRNYSGSMFLQRTAWTIEQGLGRTRRGNIDDYDTPTKINGYVAIADGDWKRVRKYFSQSLLEAIVED